jgi:hypothetical protein
MTNEPIIIEMEIDGIMYPTGTYISENLCVIDTEEFSTTLQEIFNVATS